MQVSQYRWYSQSGTIQSTSLRSITHVLRLIFGKGLRILNISCAPTSCVVTSMRPSSFSARYSHANDWQNFCPRAALQPENCLFIGVPWTPILGIFECYLQDSSHNIWAVPQAIDEAYLQQVPTEAVASRLMQMLNSYSFSNTFVGNVAGEFNPSDYGLVRWNSSL